MELDSVVGLMCLKHLEDVIARLDAEDEVVVVRRIAQATMRNDSVLCLRICLEGRRTFVLSWAVAAIGFYVATGLVSNKDTICMSKVQQPCQWMSTNLA